MRISDWSSDVCSSDLFPSFPSFPQLPSKKIAAETLPPSTWQPAEPTHLLRYPVHLRAAHCGPCPFPLQRQHEDPPCSTNISCPCCRSEEHTSELQSLMRISYAVFCLKKKNKNIEK